MTRTYPPRFREELRRHTAAVERSRAAYNAEQAGFSNRWNDPRVCLLPACDNTHKSQTGFCKEHR